MKRTFLLILTFLMLISWNVIAQEESVILLMYFEDIEIVTPDDEMLFEEDLEYEMELSVGSTLLTGTYGTAELEIVYPDDPDGGTLIRLAEDTVFEIKSVAGLNSPNVNSFQLDMGKMRSITKAIFRSDFEEQVNSPSATCGVRGTDYGIHVDPSLGIEDAYVLDGLIDYSRKGADGSTQRISLGGGQMASAIGDAFTPVEIPPARMTLLRETMGFERLSDRANQLNRAGKAEPTPEPTAEPTPEPTEEPTPEPADETAVIPAPTTAPDGAGEEETPVLPEDDPLMQWLKDVLGMEIGSITIGEKTYAKAVMQPTFQIGKLKTALYLPIIYEKDMFDPDMWYKPKGNDEWSFGTDQEEYLDMGMDFLSDLFLKIKYLQWGKQRDPFFFKIGNLDTFTIGHGLIMNNYANDADFPAIRRIGINLGLDQEKWGFEVMTNDLTDASIFGLRGYFRPVGKFAIGLSALSDISPADDLPETFDELNGVPTAEMTGDPMFFNVGLDLDQPLAESEFLSAILFADIAGMIPYFQVGADEAVYPNVTQGLHPEAMFTPDSGLKNFGAMAGVFGNIWQINYNLHARYYSGTFKPAFYNTNYDRVSGEYAMYTAQYISDLNTEGSDLSAYENLDLGIYGQAGYTMDKVFSLEIGYMWPFMITPEGEFEPATEDELHLTAVLEKGVIPMIDLSGSLGYDRTNFVPMLAQKFGEGPEEGEKALGWIDEYTVLRGELIYGVSPNLDLAALLTSAIARYGPNDPDGGIEGDIIYNEDGTQDMSVTFSLETRVHF